MGRYPKEGLDYFTVDCQLKDEEKLILAEFGLIGLGILVFLRFKIYGEEGYYTKWDSDVALVFSSDYKVGANVVNEVVRASLRRGIFDADMFDRYGILTSVEIQKKCAAATARRVSKKVDGRYLLIPMPENWISDNRNAIYVDRNAENVDRNKQSRVEYITTTTTTVPACARAGKAVETVGNSQAPPSKAEVYDYMMRETDIDPHEVSAEADTFLARNAVYGWKCLPNWKAAVDLWAARIRCPR